MSREGDDWRLAGLIDFGDVMTGWREYDLLGPSSFMTAGMPRRVHSLFRGFGYTQADITPELKRRLMALMLLHRASDLNRQICIEDWQREGGQSVRTLERSALAGTDRDLDCRLRQTERTRN